MHAKSTELTEQFKSQIDKGVFDTTFLRANLSMLLKVAGGDILTAGTAIGHPIFYCDSCGRACFAVKSKTAYSGTHWICEDCLEKYAPCRECKTLILTDDLANPTHAHDGKENPGCLVFPVDGAVAVFNADIMADGRAKFYKTPEEIKLLTRRKATASNPERVFRNFGLELEVEKLPGGPPDLIMRTRKLMDKFVMVKHDGSLSRRGKGGFEIVSMPATMAFHKSGIWTQFFQHLGPFFQEAPSTTGLHVHIGTNTLSPLTVDKMILFHNAEENREFVFGIANRNLLRANPNGRLYAGVKTWAASDMMKLKQHGTGCPWHPNNKQGRNYYKMVGGQMQTDPWGNPIIADLMGDPSTVRAACRCPEGHYNIDHYEAVNLRTHRPTVELRIFRGLVSEPFLYACLEYADSVADFCAITPLDELHFKNYLNYLSDKTKRYRNLYRLLVNQLWIDPPKDKRKAEELTKVPVYGVYA